MTFKELYKKDDEFLKKFLKYIDTRRKGLRNLAEALVDEDSSIKTIFLKNLPKRKKDKVLKLIEKVNSLKKSEKKGICSQFTRNHLTYIAENVEELISKNQFPSELKLFFLKIKYNLIPNCLNTRSLNRLFKEIVSNLEGLNNEFVNLIEFTLLKNIDKTLLEKDFSEIQEIAIYKKLVNYKKKGKRAWTDLEISTEKRNKLKNKKRSKKVIECISEIIKRLDTKESRELIQDFKSLRTLIYENVFADKDTRFVVVTKDKKKIVTSVRPVYGNKITYKLENFEPAENVLTSIGDFSPELFVLKEDAVDFIERLKDIYNTEDHSTLKMIELEDAKNSVSCIYREVEFDPKDLEIIIKQKGNTVKND